MLCFVKCVLAWIAMRLIGMNLTHMLVRGILWKPFSIDEDNILQKVVANKARNHNSILNLCLMALIVTYLWALNHYWNWMLMLAGLVLCVFRVPNLLVEIKIGQAFDKQSAVLPSFLSLMALALIWYALCKWPG